MEKVREMSKAYVDQINLSRDPRCPPPFVKDDIEGTREHVKAQFAKLLSRARG